MSIRSTVKSPGVYFNLVLVEKIWLAQYIKVLNEQPRA